MQTFEKNLSHSRQKYNDWNNELKYLYMIEQDLYLFSFFLG